MLVIWSALIVTAVWSIATGAYFAFRGDVIHSMTEMQATYDKRIADLRGEFDRVVSEQFLDQERIQHQLNVLLQQQATLEQHKSSLPDDQLATGSISARHQIPASWPGDRLLRNFPPPSQHRHRNQRAFATATDRVLKRQRDHSNNLLPLRRSWISANVILHPSELPPARQQL
ncbi:MAG: hypothetical protein WA796_28020 [Pseudolabrys sp.]